MNVYDVMALTIHSNDGVLDSRTFLKLIYYISQLIPNIEIKPLDIIFTAHLVAK